MKNKGYGFLQGGGEMGEIIRNYDWANSSISTPEQWPQSLRTTLGILLHSAFPMFLFWGEQLICFYNDAFRSSLGDEGKHPAIGKQGNEVWPEIWEFIGPLVKGVITTGEPVWYENQLIPFYRNGKIENIYWTYSSSPVYGDDGEINGVFVTCTETTKAVNSIKQLEESESFYRNMIEQAPVAITLTCGEDLVIESINAPMLKVIGKKSREEVFKKKMVEVIPELKDQPVLQIIRNVLKTGEAFRDNEVLISLVSGDILKKFYFDLSYTPLIENGKITGVMHVATDVTERVIARKKEEEKEQQLRSFIDSAPLPIAVYIGKEMRIQYANQYILNIWGKGNEVIGKLFSDVMPELQNREIFEQLDKVYDTGCPFYASNKQVYLEVDGKGKLYWFNYSFTPVRDVEGNVFGVMITAADVTDLTIAHKKIEETGQNFRNMILKAPVAICILKDPNNVVEIVNERMLESWEKTEDEVLGKSVFEILPEAAAQGFEEVLKKVYITGETFTAFGAPAIANRNGVKEIKYFNFVYDALREVDGSISGIMAVSIDVTKQVIAHQHIEAVVEERTRELAEANYQLEQNNKELNQFAYIASHDLQEPVRKVLTFAEMLEESLEHADSRSTAYLNKIIWSSQRMLKLIRDLLTYSQLSHEKEKFKPVDLAEVLEKVKGEFGLFIQEKQATINCRQLPVITANPLQMHQLFSNLLSNALKFSKEDEAPVVEITAELLSDDELLQHPELNQSKEYYYIRFSDNGIGFDEEYADKIFDIFQRLHRREEYEGTGIGLSICKKIVANHNGILTATASFDNGATFHVFLPREQP